MKGRLYSRNLFKDVVLRLIRCTSIESAVVARAYNALAPEDRDAMPYVTRALRVEG